MSTVDFSALQADVAEVIKGFNFTVTVKSRASSTPSATGSPSVSYTDTSTYALFVDFSEMEMSGRGRVAEGGSRSVEWSAGDKKLLVAADAVSSVSTEDLIEADGITYNVVGVDTTRPTTTSVLHTLHLREK